MDKTDRNLHEGLQYWATDENHSVQRYYIALCLLMAGIQDALLGRVEQGFRNLNWSATVSYYSLVHSGRLITFVAFGDYPTQHAQLRTLFSKPDLQVQLDWLDKHRKLAGVQRPPRPHTTLGELVNLLEALGLNRTQERVDAFGDALSASADLRNDSNYEALLVAHEYDHPLVTLAFNRLASALTVAAEEGLWLAIDAFNSLRCHTPESFGPAIEALVYSFLEDRLRPALENKIRAHAPSKQLLQLVRSRLTLEAPAIQDPLMEERLDMQFFSSKTRLMDRFRTNIMKLERTVGTFDPDGWPGWNHMPEGYPMWGE